MFVSHGISDLVDGLIRLMNSNFSQPVNLGNPEEHTILDFAKLVQKYAGMWSLRLYIKPDHHSPSRGSLTDAISNIHELLTNKILLFALASVYKTNTVAVFVVAD